jgi:transcription elongation factor Elf1
MNYLRQLETAAKKFGATLIDCGAGHWQIRGALLVNYYPESKRRSAYVAGTVGGREYVSSEEAVAMAFEVPPMSANQDKRRKNSKVKRQQIGERMGWFCFWCNAQLTLASSTLEHKIPLARGGLDNANNRVLACKKCNNSRGHNMPELNR